MERLTEREIKILYFLTKGYENAEISREMNISIHTVKVYISNLIQKLCAKNRTEAAYLACKYNIINS